MKEQAQAHAHAIAAAGQTASMGEQAHATGVYHGICRGFKAVHQAEYLGEFPRLQALRARRDALLLATSAHAAALLVALQKQLDEFEQYMASLTEVKWDQLAHNVVTTVGKNAMLDAALAGSAYTVTGPFMFLIGAVGYTSVPVAADTMASHATWTEAGATNAPTYTAPRKTISWSAASAGSKSPSSAPVFAMTGTGTVKGCGLVYGSGAVSTIDSTAGTLYSAGLFSGGDQPVVNTNTLTVTYSTSL